MHKYRYDRLPSSFTNMYTFKLQSGNCRLREEDGNFEIPAFSKSCLVPHIETAKIWNRLPYFLKSLTKEKQFKSQLKTFLINKYPDDCDKIKCFTCHPDSPDSSVL